MKRRLLPLAAVLLLLCGCTDIKNSAPVAQTASRPAYSEQAVEAAVYTDMTEPSSAETTEPTEAYEMTIPLLDADPDETYGTVPETEPIIDTSSVNIVCAGDNLIHTPIYRIAHEAADDNGYEFSPAYEHLGSLISDADLAILNQETILSDDFEPSSWPSFCTPTAMARDMTELGFDAFSIANNHVLDKGEEGLRSTLTFWKENYPDVPVYGAYLSDEDMNDIRTMTVNGIKFAFLGYMEHTNGLMLPASSECRVTYLSDEETMEKQIRQAREIADCVIVSVHFGIEVSNIITDQQRALSQKFADWGADIIIGTQPHTIQSMKYLDAADGRKAFVFYCLGNFISTMDNPLSMAEMLGCITVTKDNSTGALTLSDAYAVPLVNYYDKAYTYVGVYPLSGYTRETAATHCLTDATYDFILRLFRENIPAEFLKGQDRELIYG